MLDDVPAEHAGSAKVIFETHMDGGGSLKITYERPETPEEIQGRVRRALDFALGELAAERRKYEQLKAKFEDQHGSAPDTGSCENDVRAAAPQRINGALS